MIELRWLVRPGWDGPEKILQYRQQYDATIYAGLEQFPETCKQTKWSEWMDVPEIDTTKMNK